MPTATLPSELCFQARAVLEASDTKAPKLSIVAYNGGEMRVAGFGLVVIDVKGCELPDSIPILADHRNEIEAAAGSGSPSVTGGKILVRGQIAAESDAGQRVMKLHRGGFKFQASVGLEPLEWRYIEASAVVNVNGQKITASARGFVLILKSRLFEVSLVAIGADRHSSVLISAKGKTMAKATMLEGADDTQLVIEPATPQTVQAMREQAAELAAERARIDYIETNMTDPRFGQIKAQAIRENWDRKLVDDRVAAAAKTTDRPRSPGIHVVNHEANAQIIEASLCKSAGCKEEFIGKQFGEQVTNEALSARHRGMGLHSLMAMVVQAAGMSMPSTRFGNSHIKTAFEANRALQASFSTINLPGILGNTANKVLREAWDAVKVVWPLITRRVDAKDFHPFTSYRLTLKGELEQLAADGRIKHGQLIENDTENQLKTYALMLGLTRVDIINDNLNAFMQIPRSFGHLTQTHTEEIVLKTLLEAGAFFSTENGNLLEGTANVLSITGLTNAETLFSKQKDANGKLLLLNAETLLTPAVLKVTAQQLTVQTQLVGTSSSLVPGSNPHAGKFKPVSSPHLDADGPLGGGSDTAWYLFANPSVVAALEIAFLNGQDMPVIESSETDFDTLGMQWRTYYDVGCATGEEQGALKVTGVVAPG